MYFIRVNNNLASQISPNNPVIRIRTKSFQDLEKLALEGLNYHWGRNSNHAVAKNVMINGEAFEVYVNTINSIQIHNGEQMEEKFKGETIYMFKERSIFLDSINKLNTFN